MIHHSFSVELAKEFGLEGAILLGDLIFWLSKHKNNDKNYYEGRYWTYDSIKALSNRYPYMSEKTIRRVIDKLISGNIIVKGNFNNSTYDRTCWYSITDEGMVEINRIIGNGVINCITKDKESDKKDNSNWSNCPDAFAQTGKWSCPNGQMDLTKKENGIAQTGEPIPDINTDINTDIDTDINISPPNPLFTTIPKIEDVYDYYDSMHYQYTSPDRFFHYYKNNGWVAKGEPLVNWKAMFDKWEERARQKAEEANNGEYRQTSGGSGNDSEGQEERERRYHKQAAEMQKKVIEAGWWPDDYPKIYANGT